MTEPDKSADAFAGFSPFMDDNGNDYGSFEVFWWEEPDDDALRNEAFSNGLGGTGWYWQSGFPGCLPDGEPNGPWLTSRDAYENAIGD